MRRAYGANVRGKVEQERLKGILAKKTELGGVGLMERKGEKGSCRAVGKEGIIWALWGEGGGREINGPCTSGGWKSGARRKNLHLGDKLPGQQSVAAVPPENGTRHPFRREADKKAVPSVSTIVGGA